MSLYKGATRAVVLIHEFETPLIERKRRVQNSRDLVRFLKRLRVEEPERIREGVLVGPIRVPGGARFEDPPPLYVGKAIRKIASREA